MRCLLCDQRLNNSWREILLSNDLICEKCRLLIPVINFKMTFLGYPLRSNYVYDEEFSRILKQFKENRDIALRQIFLYGLKWRIWFYYRQYTMVFMPSRLAKVQIRGFSHLDEIFKDIPLNKKDLFIKEGQKDQKELNLEQRKEIGKNIHLMPRVDIPKKILLVDDILTSGSTMKAAISLLKDKNVDIKIYCLAINRRWLKDHVVE